MNDIKITTTGSFPPLKSELHEDSEAEVSIKNAMEKQIEAGVDILVDGQVRSDIVGIFARSIGLEGYGLPYHVHKPIGKPTSSITLKDLQTAAKYAKGKPLTAHVTGPTVMAESCEFDEDIPDRYRGDKGFENLTMDLAQALAEETHLIANEAKKLGIGYLQIDEPSLVYGADLDLANRAMQTITDVWRNEAGGEIILHACGSIEEIWLDLLKMPVDVLNLESLHLRDLDDKKIKSFRDSDKHLSLGVIRVNSDVIPSPQRVAKEIIYTADRLGMDRIWGITPACGLRLSTSDMAFKRMRCLVDARNKLAQ